MKSYLDFFIEIFHREDSFCFFFKYLVLSLEINYFCWSRIAKDSSLVNILIMKNRRLSLGRKNFGKSFKKAAVFHLHQYCCHKVELTRLAIINGVSDV